MTTCTSLMWSSYKHVVNLQRVSDCRQFAILLIIYFALQPILVFMCKVDGKFQFSPISVNFLTEVTKVFFAMIMLIIEVSSCRPIFFPHLLFVFQSLYLYICILPCYELVHRWQYRQRSIKLLQKLEFHFFIRPAVMNLCMRRYCVFYCVEVLPPPNVVAFLFDSLENRRLGRSHFCQFRPLYR